MADVALARRWKPVRIFESGRRLTTWTVAGMVAVLVTVLVGAVVAVGRPEPAPEGLPDAGVLTGWALPLVRALMELFAVGTIGMLLCAAFLLPASAGVLGLAGGRVLRLAGRWAWGWLACSSTMVVLVTSDVVGVPIGDVLGSSALLRYGWQLPEGRLRS